MAITLDDSRAPAPLATPPGSVRWRRRASKNVVLGTSGSLLAGYLSLVVLLPMAALVCHGVGLTISTSGAGAAVWDWRVTFAPSTLTTGLALPGAWQAIWLSVWLSVTVASVNAVMGVAIAYVLVRDRFRGKAMLEGLIDLPFALPTIVAGVVLLTLYGDASPLHINLFETWMGLLVALLFVTLPFSVRAVQPVLSALDREAEQAATTLGASGWRTFRTVVLPSLLPAVLGGFGLAFARAIGEFGSITLIAGGVGRTTTAAAYLYGLTQGFQWASAAAVATLLLVVSLSVLGLTNGLARWYQHRLAGS